MQGVVHEFVSEAQKGFVPNAFIADASMLMNLIETYINEDEDERGGLFIFLDMEKAFDRVSYEFLNDGLDALGFGENFKKSINMMYNVNNPPKRRMYVNGHYSEEFHIKSGVAQGCPLSPLLFSPLFFFFPTQELLKHSQYELLLAGHSAVFSPHLNLLGPSAGVSLSCRASPKSGAWSFHACILPAGSPNSVAANAD